jgi:hypothetical protein
MPLKIEEKLHTLYETCSANGPIKVILRPIWLGRSFKILEDHDEQTEKEFICVFSFFSISVQRKEDTNPGLSPYIKQQ